MDTSRTALTRAERRILHQTLLAWQTQKTISWLMERYGDIEHTLTCLGNMSARGQVVKFYEGDRFCGILAFDIGYVWWTPHRVCSEVFVLATEGTHGFQRHAAAELECLAKEYDAALIVAGNMFQVDNNLIGNGYKKCGFRQECSTYVKEIIK